MEFFRQPITLIFDFFLRIVHQEMDIYAARLAVCELNNARAYVPSACQVFVPTVKTTRKSSWAGYLTGNKPSQPRQQYPQYDEVTEEHLGQCLKALEERPQTWTSYSNSKQNAAVMCHAMRGEVEREREIHLHKILVSVTDEVRNELFRSAQGFAEFRENFNELSTSMRELYHNFVREGEAGVEAYRLAWADAQAEIQVGHQDILAGVTIIRSVIDETRDDLAGTSSDVQRTLQQASQQITELAVRHHAEARGVSEEIATVTELMEYLREFTKHEIIQRAVNATHDLALVNTGISSLSNEISRLESQISALSDSTANVTRAVADLVPVFNFFNGDVAALTGIVGTVATFLFWAAVFSLLSVGIWQRFMYFSGSVCASLASGVLLATIMTSFGGPVDAAGYLRDLLPPVMGVLAAYASVRLYVGFLAGSILLLSIVHRLATGRWLPYSARPAAVDSETLLPETQDVRPFRLPINNPRYVAEMAERQAMRGDGGLKRWEV